MVVSEINILEFLTQTLRLPHEEAKTHVRNLVAAEERLHKDIGERIDRKFEERKDTLATKVDLLEVKDGLTQRINALEVRMEQNTNKVVFWLVGTIFAAMGLGVALIKLL